MSKRPPRPGSSKRLASVSHDALRRASPAENVKMGFGPKARRYVKAGVVKVRKSTASVSARQAETKRVRAVYGLHSPEVATKAREHGGLTYQSEQARVTAQRTKDAAYLKKLRRQIEAAAKRHERIAEYAGPGERKPETKQIRKGRRSYSVRTGFQAKDWHASYVEDLRERKLAGEELENGDWHMMMDYAEQFKDPARHLLRASPGSFAARGSLEDE
jgi:hypothetical protein